MMALRAFFLATDYVIKMIFLILCHFDGGEIFASNSVMRIQSLSSFSRRFLLRRNETVRLIIILIKTFRLRKIKIPIHLNLLNLPNLRETKKTLCLRAFVAKSLKEFVFKFALAIYLN